MYFYSDFPDDSSEECADDAPYICMTRREGFTPKSKAMMEMDFFKKTMSITMPNWGYDVATGPKKGPDPASKHPFIFIPNDPFLRFHIDWYVQIKQTSILGFARD